MGDLLSQDEIDALLNGVNIDDADVVQDSAEETQNIAVSDTNNNYESDDNSILSEIEKDTLGEIGNISMGSAATALNEIIGQKVDITTPKVTILTWDELITEYQKPFVVTKVEYTLGLTGTNLLIMKTSDVKILTNLMMGEDPNTDRDISELELSAMSEAMNQMVGSSCTSIATMISKKIDIAPPKADLLDFATQDTQVYQKFYGNDKIVKVAFRIVVGDLIDSEIMQLLPIGFAKEMVESLTQMHDKPTPKNKKQEQQAEYKQSEEINNQILQDTKRVQPQVPTTQYIEQPIYEQPTSNYDRGYQNVEMEPRVNTRREPVNVQPVQFQSLDNSDYSNYKENIGLIMDVPLQVTVELGRATKMIREILEFGPGSIVELDKLAGEPVDILVNGKPIAKGEVVVIDENFGVRITDIVHPSKRI